MKRIAILLSMALILALAFAGCGQRAGNNPVGVTGGGENGYGSLGGSTGGSFDVLLMGQWQSEPFYGNTYLVIEFYSNGDFQLRYYDNGYLGGFTEGTFYTNGGHLLLEYDSDSVDWEYSISGYTLFTTYGGETLTWHRI